MNLKTKEVNYISLPKVVGKGYKQFWNYKGRYRVCKGSRASKKSKTTALYYIVKMMQHKDANLLVVRKVFRTLKDSCYTELKWAVKRLGVEKYWKFTVSPLEAVYLPTGQKIFFRGFDEPLKITSITVDVGCLCWAWIEEAYEITKESDFDMLDESIRGEVPEDLFKQITLTFNPWNEKIWIKKRFFDVEDINILAMTTNYMCNEFLDDADIKVFETMKKNNPRRYAVAGLGGWGIVDGLVFENWEEKWFDITSNEFKQEHHNLVSVFGLDFGFTNDPSTLFCGLFDREKKELYVFDEMYKTQMSNEDIYNEVVKMGYSKCNIVADSAEPKSIKQLKGLGLKVKAAEKGKDSVKFGIQYVQDLKIIIHPKCVNFITEISNYIWDTDKQGNKLNVPIDDFNHLIDAMRYALEKYSKKNGWIT